MYALLFYQSVKYGLSVLIDTNMSDMTEFTPIIERGLSLHKMIRYVLIF